MLDTSLKARRLHESFVREMARLCRAHGAIDLAQSFPDFPAPARLKEAACRAIAADENECSVTWGEPALREAIAESARGRHGWEIDAGSEITVTCGSSEALVAAVLGILDPGDELVVPEPFQEGCVPAAVLAGAAPRFVPLRSPAWTLDADEIAAAFDERTRGIVLAHPHDPTGRVFSRDDLEAVADLCRKWDVVAICDRGWERLVYEGSGTAPLATFPGMADRTVTIGGLSQAYGVAGWRVGWAIAPPPLTAAIRRVHDSLTVAAPTPFQAAGAEALALGDDFHRELAGTYRRKRDLMVEGLRAVGFECAPPQGGCHVLADAAGLGVTDDVGFARRLVREVGVGCVPGSAFFSDPDRSRTLVRFAFGKREETLIEALRRLEEGLAN